MKYSFLFLLIAVTVTSYGQNKVVPDTKIGQDTLKVVPAAVPIVTKNETFFVLTTKSGNYFTSDKGLFSEMVAFMEKDDPDGPYYSADSVRSIIVLGTKIDPLKRFYRSQFSLFASAFKKRGLAMNGENLYRVTGYKKIIAKKK
jgi:hypothetical protein